MYPQTKESADNASTVEFEIDEKLSTYFQIGFKITEGTATAGTIAIVVVPRGMEDEDAITLSSPFNATNGRDMKQLRVAADKIILMPDGINSGVQFTGYLDSLDYKG